MTARIGIDCRLAGKKHAGIGRYIAEFVPRIVKKPGVSWVLFFRDSNQFSELFPNHASPKNVEVIYADIQHYSIAEQAKMPGLLAKANLDLLHIPHFNIPIFYQGKIVVTIHDLLWHQHRGANVTTLNPIQYWLKYWFYKQVAQQAVMQAEHIFVPSQFIANVVTKYYPSVKDKISVTYEGVASIFKKNGSKTKKTKPNTHQLLYVGSLYPHKNVIVILQAFKQLPNYKLNIISARSVFTDKLKQQVANLGLSQQVNFLGDLSDEDLTKNYLASQALIQPSKSEGFGLTGIEAMNMATPVIASDIPIFHEIYGDAALFFDPDSPNDLVKAIQSLEDQKLYQKIVRRAEKVVSKYDWQTLVDQTWDTYTHVLP